MRRGIIGYSRAQTQDMKVLDTNVLARFFVDDPDDAHSVKQRPATVAALSERVFVSVTVLLEFE